MHVKHLKLQLGAVDDIAMNLLRSSGHPWQDALVLRPVHLSQKGKGAGRWLDHKAKLITKICVLCGRCENLLSETCVRTCRRRWL